MNGSRFGRRVPETISSTLDKLSFLITKKLDGLAYMEANQTNQNINEQTNTYGLKKMAYRILWNNYKRFPEANLG